MDKVFVNGIIFKRNPNAPEFIIGSMSVKIDEFKAFMDKHNNNGWVNLDIKKSKTGKIYVELNTYRLQKNDDSDGIRQKELNDVKEKQEDTVKYPSDDGMDVNSIPF